MTAKPQSLQSRVVHRSRYQRVGHKPAAVEFRFAQGPYQYRFVKLFGDTSRRYVAGKGADQNDHQVDFLPMKLIYRLIYVTLVDGDPVACDQRDLGESFLQPAAVLSVPFVGQFPGPATGDRCYQTDI